MKNIQHLDYMNSFVVIENGKIVRYPYHIHSQLEILYIKRGTQSVDICGKVYDLNAGDAAVIFPHTPHSYLRDDDIPKDNHEAESLCVLCGAEIFGKMFFDFGSYMPTDPIVRHADEDKIISLAAEYIHMYTINFEDLSETTGRTDNIAWSILLLSHLFERMDFDECKLEYGDEISIGIIKYINEHFRDDVTLDALAKHFYINKSYLSKLLTDKFNINLHRYLNMKRAEYAAGLLSSSNKKIDYISDDAGFSSIRTFNRAFKEYYGISPTEYRNNARQKCM